jgi:hypothetical protein
MTDVFSYKFSKLNVDICFVKRKPAIDVDNDVVIECSFRFSR